MVGGRFAPSTLPVATITRQGSAYYVLRMGEREMGGTNKGALAAYARKQGFTVREVAGGY